MSLPARSVVGLLPLVAVTTIGPETMARLPDFRARTEWFMRNRPEAQNVVQHTASPAHAGWRMLSIVDQDRLRRLLGRDARPGRVPLRPRHPRRSRSGTRPTRCSSTSTASRRRSTTSPPSRRAGSSAATRTGAGRSGCPINYLLIESLRVYERYLGTSLPRRVPVRLGRRARPGRDRRLADGAADRAVPARRRRTAAGLRRLHAAAGGPGLARPDPVPRVLPRRHRSRPRRVAPDRLDRPRRRPDHQTPPAPLSSSLRQPGLAPRVVAREQLARGGRPPACLAGRSRPAAESRAAAARCASSARRCPVG